MQYLKGMIEELEDILNEYGENLDRQYATPAAKWLFTIKDDAKPLDKKKRRRLSQICSKGPLG